MKIVLLPRTICPMLVVACALLVVGCGGDTVQISGRVEHDDGSPLAGGIRVINFVPTESSTAKVRQTAKSRIDNDGSFNLYTRRRGDGVYKGQYAVTVTVINNSVEGILLIPEEYTQAGYTPFVVDVDKNADDMLFQLKKLE